MLDFTRPAAAALVFAIAAVAVASCGGGDGKPSHPQAHATTRAETPAEIQRAREFALERRAASYARPPQAVIDAAGPTPAARDARARAELLRAAADLRAYHRAHGTYAIGPIQNLHRFDPGTALVDFVDGRTTNFYLAVNPPTTTTVWRYNFDHDRVGRVCGPGGSGCPPNRLW